MSHESPLGRLLASAVAALVAPVDAQRVRVFRAVFGLAVLVMAVDDWRRRWLFAPEWFHEPAVQGLSLPRTAYSACIIAAGLGGAALLLDVCPRVAGGVIALTHGWAIGADLLLFRNHEYLATLLGLLVLTSSVGARQPRRGLVSGAGPFLVRSQILIVYFWAVVSKVNAPFLSGWVLEGELSAALPGSPLGRLANIQHLDSLRGGLIRFGAFAAVATEAALVLCLVVPSWRRVGIYLGITLHGAIALTMNIFAFGLMIVSTYPLFVPPAATGAAVGGAST